MSDSAKTGYLHLLHPIVGYACVIGRQGAFLPCIFYQIITPGGSLFDTYTDILRDWNAPMPNSRLYKRLIGSAYLRFPVRRQRIPMSNHQSFLSLNFFGSGVCKPFSSMPDSRGSVIIPLFAYC